MTPPDPLSGRGRPRPAPIPSTATRRARRRKLPRYWDLGLGNRSPKSKFTTTPLNTRSDSWRDAIDAIVGGYRRSRRTKGRATGRAMELHDRSRRRLHRVNTVLHTHTHPFSGPFSGTTRVSRYQKGKTNLDFTEARDSERQWHQLGHMQVCTSL